MNSIILLLVFAVAVIVVLALLKAKAQGGGARIVVVHKFMKPPTDETTWDAEAWNLTRNRSTFLNVAWGAETEEIVDQWNHIFPSDMVLSAIPDSTIYTHHLHFGGRTLDVPYKESREDCMIAVLSINKLTKEQIEIRLCIESTGNSDWCFLPLASQEWKELEETYGTDTVLRKFVVLPDTWEELEKKLEM